MATAINPGDVIDGKYRVLRRIGEGGMGTVYEGENSRIERRVAIKVLHAHVASSPEFAQRFEREARASARIGSPHVCDVLDLGDLPNGERYIVMEFLDGESLEDRVARSKLTAMQLAPIAFEILEGLGSMHQAGVIHRDLKPANVFLAKGAGSRRQEVVKILDFGVAKILPKADEPSDMTSTGMMMGTPLYMSPEQARGARDVDGRTDLYAASVIFYRALTGEMPHSGLNLHELLFKIVLEDPTPILTLVPDVDEMFAAIVHKGLARDAADRYSSAREYQEEIAAWGNAQGRASLQFAVTLSSEPPPLRISGGFSVAQLMRGVDSRGAPITGPQMRDKDIGPPTPAIARTQSSTAAGIGGETPNSKAGNGPSDGGANPNKMPSGGTPTAWAEDAPEIAKRALAELEKKRAETKKTKPSPGNDPEMIAASNAIAPPPQVTHDPNPNAGATAALVSPVAVTTTAPSTRPPPPANAVSEATRKDAPRPQNLMRIVIGAGAVVVIAAAVIGAKMAGGGSSNPTTNAGSAAVLPEPKTAPPPASTTTPPTPTAIVEPTAIPSETAAASAVPSGSVPAIAKTTFAPVPVMTGGGVATKPTTATSASAKPPTTATPPTTAATPNPSTTGSGHRKFRTNLE